MTAAADNFTGPNPQNPVYALAQRYGASFDELEAIWRELANLTPSNARVAPEAVVALWSLRYARRGAQL